MNQAKHESAEEAMKEFQLGDDPLKFLMDGAKERFQGALRELKYDPVRFGHVWTRNDIGGFKSEDLELAHTDKRRLNSVRTAVEAAALAREIRKLQTFLSRNPSPDISIQRLIIAWALVIGARLRRPTSKSDISKIQKAAYVAAVRERHHKLLRELDGSKYKRRRPTRLPLLNFMCRLRQ